MKYKHKLVKEKNLKIFKPTRTYRELRQQGYNHDIAEALYTTEKVRWLFDNNVKVENMVIERRD